MREGFAKIRDDLPAARFDVRTRILEGDVLFLEWTATGAGASATDGVETFVVRDGQIAPQSVRYTVQPA